MWMRQFQPQITDVAPVRLQQDCRNQRPPEVQTLITESEYFSKLQGMAWGDKRKEEGVEKRRRGEGVSPGLRLRIRPGETPSYSHMSTPTPQVRCPLQAASGNGGKFGSYHTKSQIGGARGFVWM